MNSPTTNAEEDLIAIVRYAEDNCALVCLRRHVEAETNQLRADLDARDKRIAELEEALLGCDKLLREMGDVVWNEDSDFNERNFRGVADMVSRVLAKKGQP